jgi:RES domain-containing protein
MRLYRLSSKRYPANDGNGASLYGGRWNHKGTALIYSAEIRALCALEILASADEFADDYVITPIEVPASVAIEVISVAQLPRGWNAPEPTDLTRDIGTRWAQAVRTAVLCVPSAVIPRELNYLLNPAHSDFSQIRFSDHPEAFFFDERLR